MNILKTALFALLSFFILTSRGQSVTVMTYNLRYDNPGDGVNAWPLRKAWLCQQVKQVSPEILGIQEGLERQVQYLDSVFPGYRHIGVGREDGKNKGEYSAIFYNREKIKVKKQGTFWLSPTPEQVSIGWDAALERICTYGLFKEKKSGKYFWAFNTHFDHIGEEARKNSAVLILKKIKELNKDGYPVILTGDFNSSVESEAYRLIVSKFLDCKSADKSMNMEPEGTFNGFTADQPAIERIDFIFCGYGAKPDSYSVIRESKEGRFASDHYPVISRITLSY